MFILKTTSKPEFTVKCDEELNTQDVVANNELKAQINIPINFTWNTMDNEKSNVVKGGTTETKYFISKKPLMATIEGTIYADGVGVAVIAKQSWNLANAPKPLTNIILDYINPNNTTIKQALYDSLDNSIVVHWNEPPVIDSYCRVSYDYYA